MRVTVVNPGSQELVQLAARLAERGELAAYVGSFASVGKPWERRLHAVPYVGPKLLAQLDRRRLPDGVLPELVHTVTPTNELIRSAISKTPMAASSPVRSLTTALTNRRNRLLAVTAGAVAVEHGGLLVAAHAAALEALVATAGTMPRVLNYPSVHHAKRHRVLQAEREKYPDLEPSFPDYAYPPDLVRRFDRECAEADAIFVGSTFARDSFVEEGIDPVRLSVIPYGVDSTLFTPEPEGTPATAPLRFNILYVGQIGQAKGIRYLLDAYRSVRRAEMSLTLVGQFVGDRRVWDDERGLFRHIPHVARRDLPPIYRAASVMVFPTLFEGMGMVVLEAMACGVPVVVTRCGPDQVVRDEVDGIVVPPGDTDALAGAIERLYSDADLRLRLGRSAREQAVAHGWDAYFGRASAALRTIRQCWEPLRTSHREVDAVAR